MCSESLDLAERGGPPRTARPKGIMGRVINNFKRKNFPGLLTTIYAQIYLTGVGLLMASNLAP